MKFLETCPDCGDRKLAQPWRFILTMGALGAAVYLLWFA